MPSDLLKSNAIERQQQETNPTAFGTGTDSLVKIVDLLQQINVKVDEVGERLGLRPTHISLTKTKDLRLPLGEWSISPGINWLQLDSGDGTHIARINNDTAAQYPDIPKILMRSKMLYDVLVELLNLFRKGGTTQANVLTAVFVTNDRPINPTEVATFINMLAILNEID